MASALTGGLGAQNILQGWVIRRHRKVRSKERRKVHKLPGLFSKGSLIIDRTEHTLVHSPVNRFFTGPHKVSSMLELSTTRRQLRTPVKQIPNASQ